jgi:hypothetical protein
MTVAAKAALANKRRREAEEETKEKSEQSEEKTEKKVTESPEKTDTVKEATTEKSEPAKPEKDIFIPPQISPKPSTSSGSGQKKTVTISLPKPPTKEVKKPGKSQKFEYGNYNRYYGYRNPGACLFPGTLEDPRLYHFRPEWFFGKDVLVNISSKKVLVCFHSLMCNN